MQILNFFYTTSKISHTLFPYYTKPCYSHGDGLFVRSWQSFICSTQSSWPCRQDAKHGPYSEPYE